MFDNKKKGTRLVEEGKPYPGPLTEILPHRPPFLFVTKLTSVGDVKITGEAVFPTDTWFFKGHFPGYPVVPGVILIETMAQCGGAGLIANGTVARDGLFLLVSVDKARFRHQVRPNEPLTLEVETIQVGSRMIKQHGKAFVNGELAAEAEFACILGSRDKAAEAAK